MEGKTVSHYRILEKIGEGGMGEVYLAEDTSLERKVALKFLPDYLQIDDVTHKRFLREAKSAAAIDHPFICNIHEVSQTEGGRDYIVMEYVDGLTLTERIADGSLPLAEALQIASEIAEALEKAHSYGIVHRDLKPANIMITSEGHSKIMDFGLAKQVDTPEGPREQVTAPLTQEGSTLGTLSYMSPEQLQAEPVDERSDIFSFGIVLYEMLTGEHPFRRPTQVATANAILNQEPPPLTPQGEEVSKQLEHVLRKMLAKDRNQRYPNAEELQRDLRKCLAELAIPTGLRGISSTFLKSLRRPRVAIPLVLVVIMVTILGYWLVDRAAQLRWAREEAVPEIKRLVEMNDYSAAFALAQKAERYIPEDPVLRELWPEVSRRISVHTNPPGAEVYAKGYADPEGEWHYLGQSPVEEFRLPRRCFRWRIEKPGYETADCSESYLLIPSLLDMLSSRGFQENLLEIQLQLEGSLPPGMVQIPKRPFWLWLGALRIDEIDLPTFLIDRYEVTNVQFKEFVDAGGYNDPHYWTREFVKDGRALSWEEAMAQFRDTTGRPGPSTWSYGTYPEGKGDFPVTGVSWFEAAAYSVFSGKNLPTIHQWCQAAATWFAPNSVPLSNLEGSGLARVGSFQGISPYGVYDMAGNAREWCWNANGERRFIVGGSWRDEAYLFKSFADARLPFDRSSTNGFRCVKYDGRDPLIAQLKEPIEVDNRDYLEERPVDDKTFQIYAGLFAYDRKELNAHCEPVEESSEYWTEEKVTFKAAYGDESVWAYLFLPKASKPPYQVVIYFPTSIPFELPRTSDQLELGMIEPILRSGRAVIYPIYKGSYERRPLSDRSWGASGFRDNSVLYREEVIMYAKDLRRSIDYLETRSEIDHDRLAYFGYSYGSIWASVFLAIEERLKTAVIRDGGLCIWRNLPEIDPINFVSRVKQPVLMLNGKHDSLLPLQTNQIPMFKLLATPAEDKEHELFESSHGRPLRDGEVREIINWLDRYLGEVEKGRT